MTRTLLLLAGLLVAARGAAQPPMDTSFLTLYAETRGFLLGRPQKPKFTPDGKTVLFLRSEAKSPKQKLFAFDVATGQTKELLSPDAVAAGADESPEEKARRERQRVSAGGFADYHISPDGKHVLVPLSGRLFVLDRAAGTTRELKTGGGVIDPKWSPDGKLVGYVRGYDVCVFDLAADAERAVTTGGTREKTHGLAEFVAQEEMHRHTGYWWSPDSKLIAYEEADHAGVEVWHVADPLNPDRPPQPQYYPRPGRKNVSVRLGVVPVGGGATVWVEWDRKKYEYLAAVHWDKSGPLTVQLQDRPQRAVALFRVDPATGRPTELLRDTDPAFVNLRPDALRWEPGGEPLTWVRDGGDPLTTGYTEQVVRAVTDPSLRELAFHTQTGVVASLALVTPPGRDPGTAVPVFTVGHLEGLSRGTFGPDPGWSTVSLPPAAGPLPVPRELVVTSTTLTAMPRATYHHLDGTKADLPSFALDPPFAPKVVIEKVGDYWTAVVRPRDFDPKKKYPVLMDVYGGPRHLHVVQAMRNWLLPQWLADQGFVVVAIDNRGTPGRGREWERAIYQKFGTVPLDDQVKGLQALGAKHPELDLTRVGIVGWSFGGYMAANAVLRRPDVFHAAVAGAPVTDWEDYDTHYTERYLGLLPESRKAYDEASLLPLAKNLSRPLLLVHGTADDNVYYRHTLKLSDALFRAGKAFDVLPLPGLTHMYLPDARVTERLWAKVAGYFITHLGKPR